jgi:hypothetical protein
MEPGLATRESLWRELTLVRLRLLDIEAAVASRVRAQQRLETEWLAAYA